MLVNIGLEGAERRKHIERFSLVGLVGKIVHNQILQIFQSFLNSGVVLLLDTGVIISDIGEHHIFLILEMFVNLLLKIRKELPYNALRLVRTRENHSRKT